jgi:transcriptional regulator with XRE-family HTH domain
MEQARKFDSRLKRLLAVSGVERGELAEYLGVSVPVVNRWLNGFSAPDVYQFQAISNCFGVPYAWFLDGDDGFPGAAEVAEKLGLSPETVEALRELAGSEREGILAAVDDAIRAVIGAACAAYGEALPLAERFSHIAKEALALCGEAEA